MPDLDAIFAALSHATRRAIIHRLAGGEARLSDLAKPFDMSQTAVSKHVRILSDAGLVRVERRGRERHCKLRAGPMRDAMGWIADYQSFWHDQFDNLARHLEASEGDDP